MGNINKSNKSKAVMVIPGDDVTRAAWRFEKQEVQTELEKSEAWRKFAMDNNILDPFQIATGNDIQYFEPDDVNPQTFIMAGEKSYDVSYLEDWSIIELAVYNYVTKAWIQSYEIFVNKDDAVTNEYLVAVSDGDFINIRLLDTNIYVEAKISKIPFRPREMLIPTGQIITAGDEFYAGYYKLKRRSQ